MGKRNHNFLKNVISKQKRIKSEAGKRLIIVTLRCFQNSQPINELQEKKKLLNWHKDVSIQKANDISIAYEQIFEMDRRHDPS